MSKSTARIRKVLKKKYESPSVEEWVRTVEKLIAKHSMPARKSGRFKGHGDTNDQAWIVELANLVRKDIVRSATDVYDNNMAIAYRLGLVLCAWYFNIHRAKTYDLHRPLETRRAVARSINEKRGFLIQTITNDEIMAAVWKDQIFNFPFGLGSSGGDFI